MNGEIESLLLERGADIVRFVDISGLPANQRQGYPSCSQSEKSNDQSGGFDAANRSSKLPHKTIARLAGIGYIGKNNLLITDLIVRFSSSH